ncbi:MAG: hypothetical protein R3242_02935 [Akkermansiaceae bacterium]|nr:hypothetical protein [Akkermansiaceae bacterium]
MNWMNRLERRCGWLAFPGFLRFYAILHALVFMLQIVRPDIGLILEFNRELIFEGEVWRLVTFLFASSAFRGAGFLAIIFFFFMVLIAFMISDALEGAWGVFRTSLFYYTGILGLLVGNFLSPTVMVGSGLMLYLSSFLAFATLFPRVEFLIFFILPVQVRWLAWILGISLILGVIGSLIEQKYMDALFIFLAFANYLLWAALPALRGRATVVKAAKRRRQFETAKEPGTAAFHECAECGRTDVSDPKLEFRISADGKEYCLEHLPEKEKSLGN